MELFRALAALAEPPRTELSRVAGALDIGPLPDSADHTELFIFQLPPYASIYLGAEGMIGGEARDRFSGFWRALGQTPPPEPDHLSILLALYASLCEFEIEATELLHRQGWRRARKALLWEHLLSWLPAYVSRLGELASPFYRRWGELLISALVEEAGAVGGQESLPLHLRAAPAATAVADPRAGATTDEFLQSLLTPVRSGLILTRSDLSRAARRLELGGRAGERKFILRTLLTQEPRGTLEWLGGEAGGWIARHQQQPASFGPLNQAWADRAEATSALLTALLGDAGRGL